MKLTLLRKIPDVSIILTCYNQPITLRLVLESLARQDFPGDYEIIVCDDGSGTNIFRSLYRVFQTYQRPIRYVWQQHREMRVAQSRNNGIALSRGDILFFLDGDTIPPLDLLRRHVERHGKNRCIVIGNRKWVYSQDIEVAELSITELLRRFEKTAKFNKTDIQRLKNWVRSDKPWKTCMLNQASVTRSLAVKLDEFFVGWGTEDWEFGCRLNTRHGYEMIYDDTLTAYHYQRPEVDFKVFNRGSHQAIVHWMRGVVYFIDKYPELDLREVADGLARFLLDKKTNTWRLRKKRLRVFDTSKLIEYARQWLKEAGEFIS